MEVPLWFPCPREEDRVYKSDRRYYDDSGCSSRNQQDKNFPMKSDVVSLMKKAIDGQRSVWISFVLGFTANPLILISWWLRRLTDMTVAVGPWRFPCHRTILCGYSRVFASMEERGELKSTVTLDSVWHNFEHLRTGNHNRSYTGWGKCPAVLTSRVTSPVILKILKTLFSLSLQLLPQMPKEGQSLNLVDVILAVIRGQSRLREFVSSAIANFTVHRVEVVNPSTYRTKRGPSTK